MSTGVSDNDTMSHEKHTPSSEKGLNMQINITFKYNQTSFDFKTLDVFDGNAKQI